jgi:hypothetical protein
LPPHGCGAVFRKLTIEKRVIGHACQARRLQMVANRFAKPTWRFAAAGRRSTERDLRLDLFRGVALWLIFLDHIPENIVNWFTIRNYGFSDATEIFIFISGYTAAFVYGRAMRERGFVIASARILGAPGRFTWRTFSCSRSSWPKSPMSRRRSTTRSTPRK